MKTLVYIALFASIAGLSSCTSQRSLTVEPDDRYYNSSDLRKERKKLKKLEQEADFAGMANQNGVSTNNNDESVTNPNSAEAGQRYAGNGGAGNQNMGGTTIINNFNDNQFEMDDYYDYMYASRVRRFHRNPFGFNYYDPFFTNSFWYNPNPFMFGNSIYNGYNFWNPYSPWGWNTPGWGFGWNSWNGWNAGFGWGNNFYNPWAWNQNPFFSPWGYNPWMMNAMCFNAMAPGFWNPGFGSPMFMATNMNNSLNLNTNDQNTFYGARGSSMGGNSQIGRTEVALNQKLAANLPSTSTANLGNNPTKSELTGNNSNKDLTTKSNYTSTPKQVTTQDASKANGVSSKFDNAPVLNSRSVSPINTTAINSSVSNMDSRSNSNTRSQIYKPEPVKLSPSETRSSAGVSANTNRYNFRGAGNAPERVTNNSNSSRNVNTGTSTRNYNQGTSRSNSFSTPSGRNNYYNPPSNNSRSSGNSRNYSAPSNSFENRSSQSPNFSSPNSGSRSGGNSNGGFNSGGSFNRGGSFNSGSGSGTRSGGGSFGGSSGGGGGSRSGGNSGGGSPRR